MILFFNTLLQCLFDTIFYKYKISFFTTFISSILSCIKFFKIIGTTHIIALFQRHKLAACFILSWIFSFTIKCSRIFFYLFRYKNISITEYFSHIGYNILTIPVCFLIITAEFTKRCKPVYSIIVLCIFIIFMPYSSIL